MCPASAAKESYLDELVLTPPGQLDADSSVNTAGEIVLLREAADVVIPQVFDYAGLSKQVIKEAETVARKIRSRLRANIIETGQDLMSIKDKLGHGKFGPWLKFYFGMSERTAQNLMRAADAFHDRAVVVDRMPPAVVYKLAAKSTPEAVRNAIARDISRGALLDPQAVLSRIKAARSNDDRTPRASIVVSDAKYEVLPITVNANSSEATPVKIDAADQLRPHSANMPASAAEKFVNKMKLRFGDKFDIFRRTLLIAIEDVDSLRDALNNS